ncbi:MAG: LicD family protein [Methanobrevibacter thaueri]|nr:LicD family protein [Methanobrevibacter thaueri]
MENELETKNLIEKLDKLEKENVNIDKRIKTLENQNNQLLNSCDVLFNTILVHHEIKPKKLLRNSYEIILQMLDFIDNICKKYDLEWFLTAGSALGAIRHEGFIPWDDDCDIGLMRKDYEKFIKVIKKEVKNYNIDKYVRINTAPKVSNRVLPFTKFDYVVNGKLMGFVDIFPFDYLSSYDENTKKIFMEEHKRLRKEINEGKKREEVLKDSFNKLNITLNKNKYVMASLEVSAFGYAIYNYEDFFPLKRVKFIDRYYPAPYDLEVYNETLYGSDFMKVPKSVRIHDFHYRLLKTENINNLFEKHIVILNEANEKFRKSIESKNTKTDGIICGKGQTVERIDDINKECNKLKITRIGDTSTWTDIVIKDVSENDYINAKFNISDLNSTLSIFFVYINYNRKETFSNSIKLHDNDDTSKLFTISTPIGENIQELHLRFWIVDNIEGHVCVDNLTIEKTFQLKF